MTSRRLLILAALAVVVILGALLLSKQQATTAGGGEHQPLYPDLKGKLDAVSSVRIFKAGDAPLVEVKRAGNDWVVASRNDYPADAARIRKFLIATADAKLVEEKTSNPANYPALGVEDTKDAKATGHRVEIAGTPTPINFIIGKQAAGARSQYVRRVSDKESWMIGDSLDLPTVVDTWLRKDVIDVAADRVQSVTIATDGAKPYTVARASRSDTHFAVDGLPKGKELSSPAALDNFASAMTALTLADVRKAQELQTTKSVAHATLKTFDGLVAEADGWVQDNKHYLALATSYDDALAARFKAPAAPKPAAVTTPPAKSDAAKEAPERDVAVEVKTQNAQLAGWAYEIPQYKYEAIFKPLDDLLKKDEPKK